MSVSEATQWFICREGRAHGPLSQLALAQLAVERRIAASDFIWCTGLADWVAADEVPGLLTRRERSPVASLAVRRGPAGLARNVSGIQPGWYGDVEVRRTPLAAFAPQPRRMLLSEALDQARAAEPASGYAPAEMGVSLTDASVGSPSLSLSLSDVAPAADAADDAGLWAGVVSADGDADVAQGLMPFSAVIATAAQSAEDIDLPIDDGLAADGGGDVPAIASDAAQPEVRETSRALSSWASGLAGGITGRLDRVLATGAGVVGRMSDQLPGFGLDTFWQVLDRFDADDLAARFADALERHDVRTPADLLNDDRMDVVSSFLLENLPFTLRWGILLACGEDGFRRLVVYRMRDQLRVWIGPQRQDADIGDMLNEALRARRSGSGIEPGWADLRGRVTQAVAARFGRPPPSSAVAPGADLEARALPSAF